ncbi:hypothetical protein VSR68_24910 [Paraburkholderia phymatum]|uniref:hypothetical protein n=1 Tax=Paraburkholderia phymatum TaxID=148447 RepID=UPI003179702E
MGVILGLMALGAMAQEAASDVNASTQAVSQTAPNAAELDLVASGAIAKVTEQDTEADKLANLPAKPASAGQAGNLMPPGVVTETNPLKVAFMAKSKAQPALFRPNQNMPEITNEDLIRGYAENGEASGRNVSSVIGYMPKLKVLPCPVDCQGSDYEKAVAAFINGFEGEGNHFKPRGEMIVQVRWFHQRPWYQRGLPYGADDFGVKFMLEGKVISLGKATMVGGKGSIDSADLAHDIGARMAVELAFTLGMGVKPTYLDTSNNLGKGLVGTLSTVNTTIGSVLGAEDVRPRVEPATDASVNLLPAIDGIQPNEIAPITEPHFINSILF